MEHNIVQDYEDRFAIYRVCITITAVLSIPLTTTVVYLIQFKSPKQMRTYKFLLINISAWSFITDMLLEVIALPLPVFEVLGMYSKGLARFLPPTTGFIFVVAIVFAKVEYFTALFFAFFHRYHVLHKNNSVFGKTLSKKHLWVAIPLTMVIPAGSSTVAASLSYIPFSEFKELALKAHPELEPFFDRVPIFGLNRRVMIVASGIACFWVVLWTTLVIWCVLGIIKQFRINKTSMSNVNYRLHLQLMRALSVQTLAPLLLYVTPVFILAISVIFKLDYINDAFQLAELALSVHSIVNSLAVILLVAPYRKALLNMLHITKKAPVSVVFPTHTSVV